MAARNYASVSTYGGNQSVSECDEEGEGIERAGGAVRFPHEKALKISRTYNTFICSIIKNSADWTLENGYRTIIATLGITLDGVMRNKIGDVAEQRVRGMVLEFLFENDLIVEPRLTREEILDNIPGQCELPARVLLKFGAEPDISFSRVTEAGAELLAIVEIKGDTDPAGALERYGAAIKSFQDALTKNSRCKNFFLSAVYTAELERRIHEDRLVEKYFNLIEILEKSEERQTFFRELFHFTLRLL